MLTRIRRAISRQGAWFKNKLAAAYLNQDTPQWLARPLFEFLAYYAAHKGVNRIFIDRARQLFMDGENLPVASEFLQQYIKLQRGEPIRCVFNYFTQHLQTEEEKRLTAQLVEMVIARDPEAHHEMKVHLFRLRDAGPDDPDVREFVRTGLDMAIESFLKRHAAVRPKKHLFVHEALVRALHDIFETHGARFFVDTLIVLQRNKAALPYIKHVDVGVFAHEVALEDVAEWVTEAGFDVNSHGENRLVINSGHGINIHVLVYHRENGAVVHRDDKGIFSWRFSNFDLVRGPVFWEPDNVERFLFEKYGDWRRTPLYYNDRFDSPALFYQETPEALEFLTNALVKSLNSGARATVEGLLPHLRDTFGIDYTHILPHPTTEPPLPPGHKKHAPRPILVMTAFLSITPHHMRMVEAAFMLADDVIIGVVPTPLNSSDDGTHPMSPEDQLKLAQEIRGVSDVRLMVEVLKGDIGPILDIDPRAVLVSADIADRIPEELSENYDVFVLDKDFPGLDVAVGGRIIVRERLMAG